MAADTRSTVSRVLADPGAALAPVGVVDDRQPGKATTEVRAVEARPFTAARRPPAPPAHASTAPLASQTLEWSAT